MSDQNKHITDASYTYQCIECGKIKPDSHFEPSGNSEICWDCELENTEVIK